MQLKNTSIIPISKYLCEPQLSKRNLYPSISTKKKNKNVRNMMNVLSYCDGNCNVQKISLLTKISYEKTLLILRQLKKNKLITFKSKSKKNIHCIVQARLKSSRLPGKIFLTGYKKSLIDHLIERLKFSKKLSKIIIAAPENKDHTFFKDFFKKKKVNIFYGDEINVLKRYFECAKKFKSDIIVRVTSDSPLIDHRIIDEMIVYFKKNNFDYLSNSHPPYYPNGLYVEIFTFETLEKSYLNSFQKFQKEHVTPYIWKNPGIFNIKNFKSKYIKKNINKDMRLTLDYIEDYILISFIFKKLYPSNKKFSFNKIYELLKNSDLKKINKKYI
tara:strand:+ start:388 stop:1374 length:987 start_codon:yes stop_codon:yes gene_type:complete